MRGFQGWQQQSLRQRWTMIPVSVWRMRLLFRGQFALELSLLADRQLLIRDCCGLLPASEKFLLPIIGLRTFLERFQTRCEQTQTTVGELAQAEMEQKAADNQTRNQNRDRTARDWTEMNAPPSVGTLLTSPGSVPPVPSPSVDVQSCTSVLGVAPSPLAAPPPAPAPTNQMVPSSPAPPLSNAPLMTPSPAPAVSYSSMAMTPSPAPLHQPGSVGPSRPEPSPAPPGSVGPPSATGGASQPAGDWLASTRPILIGHVALWQICKSAIAERSPLERFLSSLSTMKMFERALRGIDV